jgi:2-methylisocitrate lyase-like PEP mutase family enzyme
MQRSKAEAFRRLHGVDAPVLVLPNAWDAGSAKLFAQAGFPAVATTSAGIAFAAGLPDGGFVPRNAMMRAIRDIVDAVPLPVTADIEDGYGPSPDDVAETVRLATDAGAVGVNIEDARGNAPDAGSATAPEPLYAFELAVERIRAARAAADATGIPLVINARTDTFVVGLDNAYAEGIRRLNAYAAAGADCLFLPGVTDASVIQKAVRDLAGPLNIVAGFGRGPLNVATLSAMDVRRVSVGGSVARTCYALIRDAASEILNEGTFGYANHQIPHDELNRIMSR